MSVDEALKYIVSMGVVAPLAPPAARRQPAPPASVAADTDEVGNPSRPAPDPAAASFLELASTCVPPTAAQLSPTASTGPDRHPLRLGAPPPRPRRRDLHRPARPRGPARRSSATRTAPTMFAGRRERAQRVRACSITGKVRAPPGGHRERQPRAAARSRCCATQLEVLNASVTPPFQLDDDNLSRGARA
jgi:hypothetical protein